jgi:hypothetical protein
MHTCNSFFWCSWALTLALVLTVLHIYIYISNYKYCTLELERHTKNSLKTRLDSEDKSENSSTVIDTHYLHMF